MKASAVFVFLFIGLVGSAYGSEDPCALSAQRLFKEVTGKAPGQFEMLAQSYSAYADAPEYEYLAANGMSSAYVIRYYFLDGRNCFLNSLRFEGDL